VTNQTSGLSKPSLGIIRTYWKNGAFYWVSPANKWVRLGATEAEARDAHAKLAQVKFQPGTVGSLLERFVREVVPSKSARTQADYQDAVRYLTAAFGTMAVKSLDRRCISDYLTKRGAPVRANREVAVLSAALTYAMNWGMIQANPCYRLKRNPETGRSRYVENSEFTAVKSVAPTVVQDVMEVGYVTSQRISDVLKIKLSDLRDNGIYVCQNKTGARLLLRMSGDVADMVKRRAATAKTYLFEHDGKPYTYDGYASMFKRATQRALDQGLIEERFTIHDLRAKSLTDADLRGLDAQKLAGHTTRKQTEEYIKRRRTVEVDSLESI